MKKLLFIGFLALTTLSVKAVDYCLTNIVLHETFACGAYSSIQIPSGMSFGTNSTGETTLPFACSTTPCWIDSVLITFSMNLACCSWSDQVVGNLSWCNTATGVCYSGANIVMPAGCNTVTYAVTCTGGPDCASTGLAITPCSCHSCTPSGD